METILSIEEFSEDKRGGSEGVIIATNKQVIELGISNDNKCCEQWGYLMSEDDYNYFIGAELYSIEGADCGIGRNKKIDKMNLDSGGLMFINLNTSRGLLQFVCYNSHNGYYSHLAYVRSIQLDRDDYI